MRIIAGQHRGRRLLGPADSETTRPITDRVKTALFDRLAAMDRLEGAVVADLFSGTGSMGLECLSRDAAFVTFVERDRVARDRLTKNLETIGESDKATVLAFDALGETTARQLESRPPSLAFVDPPYRMMTHPRDSARVVRQLSRLADVMSDNAFVVLRIEEHVDPPTVEPWGEPEVHPYGSMLLCFYTRSEST